ncbi:MAG: sulfotransferase [Flavobacteriales bacterium]
MKSLPTIFIVGNSRSGTTMMLRIMGNHPSVHPINEPHFFGTLWSPSDKGNIPSREEAAALLSRMITRQRDGFFAKVVPGKFDEEVSHMLDGLNPNLDRIGLFKAFMAHECELHDKTIPCEKTPQDIFYIREILEQFPGAKVVVMQRDPRAVMLSQKRKWMRQGLGNQGMPDKEVRRLRMNYHPYTIASLWNSSARAAERFKDDPNVVQVRFEDLTTDPQGTLMQLCQSIGIPFDERMLEVPHAGSSSAKDDLSRLGVRKDRTDLWRRDLEDVEIAICQRTCAMHMKQLGYEQVKVHPTAIKVLAMWVKFPFKLAGAFAMNLSRMRNIVDTLQRRIARA